MQTIFSEFTEIRASFSRVERLHALKRSMAIERNSAENIKGNGIIVSFTLRQVIPSSEDGRKSLGHLEVQAEPYRNGRVPS